MKEQFFPYIQNLQDQITQKFGNRAIGELSVNNQEKAGLSTQVKRGDD